METAANTVHREPWNKGKIVGQKAPFKVKDIWALRVRLQMENRVRELALFNLGIDSKLRGRDLVSLKVRDVCHGDQVASRAVVMQHKTQRPVQFEITPATRDAVQKWIKQAGLRAENFVFPSRIHNSPHLGHSAVRSNPRRLGRRTRTRPGELRHALDASYQGDADLPAHQEPPSRAAAARTLQAGVDGEIPRHRGR
jgi:integrase